MISLERTGQVGVERGPAIAFGTDERDEPLVDARGDRGEALGRRLPRDDHASAVARSRAVEVGDHLVDAQPGGADAVAAQRDQLGRSGDPVGELVDVDVAGLQLGEDALELAEGLGVAERFGVGSVGVRDRSWV